MKLYEHKMSAKLFGIEAGALVVIMHDTDARELGINPNERVEILNKRNGKKCVAVIDTSETIIKDNQLGLYEDAARVLEAKNKDQLIVTATKPLKSVDYIKKKMDGETLTYNELFEIVNDLGENRLSNLEGGAFVTSIYLKGLNLQETISMTKALIRNGKRLEISKHPIVDKHSVGGVNGRASMIIIPIVAAAGLYVPKTSSRSITSCAGTADAMEVLAPVSFSLEKIKKMTEKTGAVIVWGGAVDLAPADDKIITLERPLCLDPEGQVIASVLAKKASVGSEYVIIDLPVGKYVKVKDKKTAVRMAKKFVEVGRRIGMEIEAVITNGEEPSGLAFGPALEAKYALEILEGGRFDNLAQKSCELAGALFELVGLCRQGKGYHYAKELLESGKGLKKMQEIIHAQGGKVDSSRKIVLSPLNKEIFSKKEGIVKGINTALLIKIARTAGAPANKLAGLMLNKKVGDRVQKGDLLFTIYAENERKISLADSLAKKETPFLFEGAIMEKIT